MKLRQPKTGWLHLTKADCPRLPLTLRNLNLTVNTIPNDKAHKESDLEELSVAVPFNGLLLLDWAVHHHQASGM